MDLAGVGRGGPFFCCFFAAWVLQPESGPSLLVFWGCFPFFGPLPSFSFVSLLEFGAVSLEVTVLMAVSAFEGQLLVVQLLEVMPITYRDLDCFW